MATTLDFSFEFRNKRFKDAEAGFRAFARAIKQDWDGSAKVLSSELREFLDGVAQALAQRHGGAWPGGTTTNTLSSRSGAMVQTIVESVEVNGRTFDKITGQIGGSMIAAVQEFGATITPKTAKYLTVPLPAALDSQGHAEKEERAGLGQHLRRPVEGRQSDHFPARRGKDRPALRAEEQRHHPAEARHAQDARHRHPVFRRAGDGRARP